MRTPYHFDPPVSDEEIHAAALPFVRKVRGFTKPFQATQESFWVPRMAGRTVAAGSGQAIGSRIGGPSSEWGTGASGVRAG